MKNPYFFRIWTKISFKNIEISFIKPKFPLRKWILDTVTCLESPRVSQRSVYRDNPDVSDVGDSTQGLDYFCVAVYIPFLDTIQRMVQ
jgi:hypothetical protein